MTAFRCLQPAFVAPVAAHIGFGWGYSCWNLSLLVLAYAVVTLVNRVGGTPDRSPAAHEPVAVAPPVTGRWSALNSPADRTPSHGVHSYGQTFALDIVAEPEPGARRGIPFHWHGIGVPRNGEVFDVPEEAAEGASPTPAPRIG